MLSQIIKQGKRKGKKKEKKKKYKNKTALVTATVAVNEQNIEHYTYSSCSYDKKRSGQKMTVNTITNNQHK